MTMSEPKPRLLKSARKPGRRTFLQALGLATGSLALSSVSRRSWANEDEAPMRLLVFYTHQGTHYPNWRMSPPGETPGQHDQWELDLSGLSPQEFSPILRPLHPYRDRMVVLDGLAMLTAMADPHGDAHARGWNSSLTGDIGSKTVGVKALARSPSIDQLVGDYLRETVPDATDLMSLVLTQGTSAYPFHHSVWRSKATGGGVFKVPYIRRPSDAFEKLFPTPPEPGSVGEKRLSVLDRTREEFNRLAPRLDGADRSRLELHRELIRDLEHRIDYLQGLSCGAPELVTIPEQSSDPAGWFNETTRAFTQVIGAGFACGTTRVATLMSRKPPFAMIGGGGDYHHNYAHQANTGDAHVLEVITNAERTHSEQIAMIANELDQIPDVGGGSVLDNTLIMWVGELAAGWHSHTPWPVVLVGGAAGKFNMGRYIRYPQNVPQPRPNKNSLVGQAHNHLLVSVAQAMGLPVEHVGLKTLTGYPPGGGSVQLGLTGGLAELG